MRILQLITMMLFTLVAGVFWGTWFSLSRSIASIMPSTFLEVGHTMIGNLGRPMSLLIPVTTAVLLGLMIALYRHRDRRALWLAGAAFVLLVAATAITLTVNVPIDDQIRSWTLGTLPANWEAIRNRWEFYHGLRTALGLAGLACLFASVLWSGRDRGAAIRPARA